MTGSVFRPLLLNELSLEYYGAAHDMGIREDVPVRVDDYSGANALLLGQHESCVCAIAVYWSISQSRLFGRRLV